MKWIEAPVNIKEVTDSGLYLSGSCSYYEEIDGYCYSYCGDKTYSC